MISKLSFVIDALLAVSSVWLLATLVGCGKAETSTYPLDLKMDCFSVDNSFLRCENSEVVCYNKDCSWK